MQIKKRVIFTSFLLLAFMTGAWGNVLAAAFCPHIGSLRACCLKHKSPPSPSAETHEMHDMDMDMGEMQMAMSAESTEDSATQKPVEPLAELEQDSQATVVDQPIETCSHCLSHSQLPLGSTTLRETESAKRGADLTAAPQVIGQVSLTALPSLIVDQREHSPPGSSSPRHILINVFRI
jgi:hypothetical protein